MPNPPIPYSSMSLEELEREIEGSDNELAKAYMTLVQDVERDLVDFESAFEEGYEKGFDDGVEYCEDGGAS